jgi:hypothetical protein
MLQCFVNGASFLRLFECFLINGVKIQKYSPVVAEPHIGEKFQKEAPQITKWEDFSLSGQQSVFREA